MIYKYIVSSPELSIRDSSIQPGSDQPDKSETKIFTNFNRIQ